MDSTSVVSVCDAAVAIEQFMQLPAFISCNIYVPASYKVELSYEWREGEYIKYKHAPVDTWPKLEAFVQELRTEMQQ